MNLLCLCRIASGLSRWVCVGVGLVLDDLAMCAVLFCFDGVLCLLVLCLFLSFWFGFGFVLLRACPYVLVLFCRDAVLRFLVLFPCCTFVLVLF